MGKNLERHKVHLVQFKPFASYFYGYKLLMGLSFHKHGDLLTCSW